MPSQEASILGDCLRYHHVHFYADSLGELAHYKRLEAEANAFTKKCGAAGCREEEEARALWKKMKGEKEVLDPEAFKAAKQDLIEQLICGAGWRVVASQDCSETSSFVVSSQDQKGVRFIISAPKPKPDSIQEAKAKSTSEFTPDIPDHFSREKITKFYNAHAGKAGVAVLGFEVTNPGGLEKIIQRYGSMHPALLIDPKNPIKRYSEKGQGEYLVAEAYAYYSNKDDTKADLGTTIRFVELDAEAKNRDLPGFTPCDYEYPLASYPAYCDHWVSNVFNRKQFLQTLEDVLGFTPKVDFNAGVVAAGEAIIESTVTGNQTTANITKEQALKSHNQVYLPINNALSTVGHVHLFLDQLGQGIQHIASRVSDVVRFVALVNFRRRVTGQGFSFLRIPRSYYGRLDVADLINLEIDEKMAENIMSGLLEAKIISPTGVVKDLDITESTVEEAVLFKIDKASWDEFKAKVVPTVLRARYVNLYKLLRDHLSEATYISIVRNQVLVDIQGNDVLFQIFTCNILQRDGKDEAPFLEFIQRVCSERKDATTGKPVPIRPGCGGFGIRNFLTLFLSIEVSKAMRQQEAAIEAGDKSAEGIAAKRVRILTSQLDVSNPVLTAISDAMTAESDARASAAAAGGEGERAEWERKAKEWRQKKIAGNKQLQAISDEYKAKMREVREEEEKLAKA